MAFNIEVLSIGGDFDQVISEAATVLNGAQNEFRFDLVPERLRSYAASEQKAEHLTLDVFQLLQEFRKDAKGNRPFLIGVIDQKLRSTELGNIFGSREARQGEGEAVITLADHQRFAESAVVFLCYYFIRYALSFVCPDLFNHEDTRNCFFDRKRYKPDLKLSLATGGFCDSCRAHLWSNANQEINIAVQKMIAAMKSVQAASEADINAKSLFRQVDVGIITIREDEFEAMLAQLPPWRNVTGTGSNYQYSKVPIAANEELRVVVARSPEQGQGAAQALASSMINDLRTKWIFVVGIAGSFPAAEYTLGDVLLSQRLHDFAVSAAIEGKPPEFQDMGGPMVLEVEKVVKDLKARRAKLGAWNSNERIGMAKPRLTPPDETSDKLYGSGSWKKKVAQSLARHFPRGTPARSPDFFAAVIIDGNKLLKDTTLAGQWRQNARHASGVEMELGGVCRAARYSGDGQTRVLAIRGISDIVGYDRSPEWTEYACRSAAAFAGALLRSGIIQRGA
jgi:nucleoside phosphorylase